MQKQLAYPKKFSPIQFLITFSYLSLKYMFMNLQTEKLNILQTILNTNDESLIMDIKTLVDNSNIDWFKHLTH